MFARLASIALLALPILATVTPHRRLEIHYSCDTGVLECCESVQNSGSPDVTQALENQGLTGLLGSVTGLVGLNCVPIFGDTSCSSQPVCCSDNNFNGVVNLGCSPVNGP